MPIIVIISICSCKLLWDALDVVDGWLTEILHQRLHVVQLSLLARYQYSTVQLGELEQHSALRV